MSEREKEISRTNIPHATLTTENVTSAILGIDPEPSW